MEGLGLTDDALRGGGIAAQLSPRSLLEKVDEYNRTHNIENMLQQMLVSLFSQFPDDPHTHMVEFVESHRAGIMSPMSAAVQLSAPDWTDRRSTGMSSKEATARSTARSKLDTDRVPRSVISGYGNTTNESAAGESSVRSRVARNVSHEIVAIALAELDD
jgi:hypothetical protein